MSLRHRAASKPAAPSRPRGRGFTLIELLVVMVVVALLLSIVAPRSVDHIDRARDTTLRATLKAVRAAIDQFEADKGRLPASLDELVEQRYLNELPLDPVTERRDTWIAAGPEEVRSRQSDEAPGVLPDRVAGLDGVADVHSGAQGESRDGTLYRDF